MSDLDKISSVFNAKINTVKTKDQLQNIKTEFFGKNGQITQQFKTLGNLDSENLNSLFMLFTFLKSQFDFLMIISHLDSVRDVVDNLIDINKNGNFSKISYE